MKKTLVALAALAATGAFAQVSITGGVAMGWAGTKDPAGVETSGLGVDTATLSFGVSEDLGGGMKIDASQGFDTLSRAGGAVGGDTTMALSFASGLKLTLGSTQLADYLQGGIANVSSAFNGWEGRLVAAKTAGTDWATVAYPVGPLTLSVTKYEGALGLGSGMASNTAQGNVQYQVAYAAGALAANAAFKSYENQGTVAANKKSVTRASVSYDFGAAKVGAGMATTSLNTGSDTESMVSVGVPFGSLFVGANYMNRTTRDTGADYNYSGYALELDYALSKSTKIVANYMNWQQTPGAASATAPAAVIAGYVGTNSTLTEIALVKNF